MAHPSREAHCVRAALQGRLPDGFSENQHLVRAAQSARKQECLQAEPLVQRQGANRIVVELPGVQDTAEAKRILGKTANLEFRLAAEPTASKASTESFEFREPGRPAVALERGLIITGDQVTDAQASQPMRTPGGAAGPAAASTPLRLCR